ncbi:MAG: hypothetical protein DYG89_14030 [Caldilinea sp. CFX5]|nr:hypothetical protein [Caldilinea sp. CFX5]
MSEQTMHEPKSYVRKRPWYAWLVWLIWLALLVFLVQNAVGSSAELEPRAAMIFWVSAGVVLLAGLVINFVRGRG